MPALLRAAEPNGASDLPASSLKPPRGEILPSFWEQHGTWIILGGIVILTLLATAIWLLLRPKPPVPISPAVQARTALEPLRQQREDGAVLSRTSQILRRYLTASFGLAPGEYTTGEFCRELGRNKEIGPALAGPVTEFLRACDFRKFAPESGAAGTEFGAVARALSLIEQAETRLGDLRPAAASNTNGPKVSAPPEQPASLASEA